MHGAQLVIKGRSLYTNDAVSTTKYYPDIRVEGSKKTNKIIYFIAEI
jgi:hypothetical protein